MAKKIKPHNYYSRRGASGFKIPSGNEPYTFLNSLAHYGTIGFKISNIARTTLDASRINMNEHTIANGLSFLKSVATAQRAHEISFIETRLNNLKTLGLQGTELDDVYNTLEQIKAGEQINYPQFIQGLNTVITNLEKYRTRLKAFNTTAISNIPQVRMVENLATTIGSYADSRRQLYYSQEEAIRQLTLKWLATEGKEFISKQTIAGITGGMNIAAALAIISQQMARYIYDTRQLKERHVAKTDLKGKYADFKSAEEFANFINNVDLKAFEKYTNASEVLKNDQLLKEIQAMYGISYDEDIAYNGRKIGESASKEIQEVKALLKNEPLITDDFKDIMNHITVKWNGKQGGRNKLALENELVSAIAPAFNEHIHMGNLNMGTDILLGSLGISSEFDSDNGEISNSLQRIVQRLRNESAINSPNKSSKIYLEELEKLDQALSGLSKGFIIHETTKNYNTLERGRWPDDMHDFSGREMNLFNYISSIQLMGNMGVDTKNLAFIAMNLATDAIGASLKAPLEHCLAIFAGIIMFDDFAVIGQEVTEGMQFSNVEALHLYKLQDTYFPASMFLDATYQAMTQLENELLAGNGFTVEISVPTINYYTKDGIPDYRYGAKFEQRWEGVRNYARANTTIHLHFAAGFLSLMSALL